MNDAKGKLLVVLTALLLGGCGPKNLVVLVPAPDGHVGRVQVSTEAGTREVAEPRQAVAFGVADAPPEAPREMKRAEINEMFGELLASEPEPAKVFLLFFEPGGSVLQPASEALIPDILQTVIQRRSLDISVVGHTDRAGSAEFNYRLSLSRAQLIRDRLVAGGVAPEIIHTTSHGEGNPILPTEDDVEEARNRRVEVTVR